MKKNRVKLKKIRLFSRETSAVPFFFAYPQEFVTLTAYLSFTKALALYYYFNGVFEIAHFTIWRLPMIWILLTLLYGLLKGGREISKKKAMDKSSVMEVLLIYTLIGFLIVVPRAPHAMGMEPYQYGLVLIKSFSIFIAWMMGFHALKHLPVSLYGVLDLSRVLLGMLLGVIVLHEVLLWNQILGLTLVVFGLMALRFKVFGKRKAEEEAEGSDVTSSENASEGSRTKFVLLAFGSCVLNSVSALLDKILMKDISSSQMQFWYMLFLLVLYSLYVVVTRTKIRKEAFKNGWIWLMSIMFVIGDASLFIANADPNSLITVMTVVKQSACFVTILGGKFVFHEKGIAYRLFCASIIFTGIIFSTLGV